MMVNNSTNINKINSHLKSLNTKKNETFADGNPCPGLGQEQKYVGVKSINGIPPSLYYLIITNQIL
jgi:hypothetical protein